MKTMSLQGQKTITEQEWRELRNACFFSGGAYVIPEFQRETFLKLMGKKGARYVVRDGTYRGRFHNQVEIPDETTGETLVFNYYSGDSLYPDLPD